LADVLLLRRDGSNELGAGAGRMLLWASANSVGKLCFFSRDWFLSLRLDCSGSLVNPHIIAAFPFFARQPNDPLSYIESIICFLAPQRWS
jgi:hypothetical protein